MSSECSGYKTTAHQVAAVTSVPVPVAVMNGKPVLKRQQLCDDCRRRLDAESADA